MDKPFAGPDKPLSCTCHDCGFTWRRGQDGSHSCVENLQTRYLIARAESEEYQLFAGELVGRLGLDREEMERKPDSVGNQILAAIDALQEANRHLAECNDALKRTAFRVVPKATHLAVAERDELLEELLRLRRKLRELAGGDEQRASGGGAIAALEKAAILRQAFGFSDFETATDAAVLDVGWYEAEKERLRAELAAEQDAERAGALREKIRLADDEILRLSDPAAWATQHATAPPAASD